MTNLGLPVPPGFTITTEACRAYLAERRPAGRLEDEVTAHLAALEKKMGRALGDAGGPAAGLVRSGAKFSMPGMMETVLNIGLNDESVAGLARQSDDERFALDSYRRLLQMFGATVLGVDARAVRRTRSTTLKEAKGTDERPRPRRRRPARRWWRPTRR